MLQINAYATAVTVIVAIVLAVARDVPVFHVFWPPKTAAGTWTPIFIAVPAGLAIYFGRESPPGSAGRALFAVAWVVALVYFWWCIAWHLRERR